MAAIVLAGIAVGSASPARADEGLNGDYKFVNGPTTNTWSITTRCNPEGKCAGTLSSSTGLVAAIERLPGGPWTVDRHDVPNGWTCPDGRTGAADMSYSFDPVSLAGTLNNTSKPGACGDPNAIHHQQPITLLPA